MTGSPGVMRFGAYELDPRAGELTRSGRRVHLPPQAITLLTLLASRAGELVTRDEIRVALWPDGTAVEFEPAVNACISQIRVALGDKPTTPRFIETLPRRGYRFVAPVSSADAVPASVSNVRAPADVVQMPAGRGRARLAMAVAALIVAGATGLAVQRWWSAPSARVTTLADLPIDAPAGDPELATLGELLQERTLVELFLTAGNLGVLARPAVERLRGDGRDLQTLREIAPDYWIDATLQRLPDGRVRLHNKVARLTDFRILWASDLDFPYDLFVRERAQIAAELARHLVEAVTHRTAAGSSPDVSAVNLALSAALALDSNSGRAAETAVERLRRSLEVDAANTIARGLLARALARQALVSAPPRDELLAEADEAARRTLAEDPLNVDALAARGAVELVRGSPAAGDLLSTAAARADAPRDAFVWQARWLSERQRHEAAIAAAGEAERRWPVSRSDAPLARAYFLAARYPEALAAARRVLTFYPGSSTGRQWACRAAAAGALSTSGLDCYGVKPATGTVTVADTW